MSNNNNHRGIFGGKGYYIALILCALVIGISGFAYYRSQTQTVSLEETQAQDLPLLLEEPDIPAIATDPKQVPTVPATQPATPPSAQEPTQAPTQPKALKTMSPVAGQELTGYSMEALSYNQTTRDWRTHNGVDLAAEAGTPVCAAADGVVESAYEDDSMGYTVIVRHTGGYTTCYASLAPELSVKNGDSVRMGQVIGCVGESSLVETTLGPHVHFSVTHQSSPMDPAQFLAIGK